MPENLTREDQWFIIVNPAAGGGEVQRRWPSMEARLRRELPVGAVVFSNHREQAVVLAMEGVRQGYRYFIAVGGDGTNHEVINGLMQQTAVPAAALKYALLPVGTGNDWGRMYGIPHGIDEWLEMIREGHIFRQDIGLVEYQAAGERRRRYFANVAGMAYDAFVVRYVEANKRLVRNRFVYLGMILRCLFRYRLQRARVRFDGEEREGRFYTINVGICKFSGGGMSLVPHALPGDGRLALTLAGPVSKPGVLFNTWRFYNGSIGRHPLIDLFQAGVIEVTSLDEHPVELEADGEYLGETPVRFELIPQALPVVIPRR